MWFVLVVGVIATLVISLAAFAFRQEKLRYRERAIVATQNIVNLLDQQINDVFEKIDISLMSIVLYCEERNSLGQADPGRTNAYLSQQKALLPDVVSLRIVDRQGWVRLGEGVPTSNPVSLADRDFFVRARDDARAGLIVSGPVFGRISKQWIIVLARRIHLPDGSFGGVVYASISTDRFERYLSRADLGSRGAATIRTTDLALVHRFPDGKSPVGSTQVSQQLRDIMAAHSEAGTYIADTALDGIERSNAYRKLQHYPFYVIVGLATDDYLDGLQRNYIIFGALTGLAVAAIALGALLLYRSARRLAAVTEEFRDLYDHAPCGYYSVDAHGKYIQINATALGWLGCTHDEVVGKKGPMDFLTAEGKAEFLLNFPRLKSEGHLDGIEFDLLDKSGQMRRMSLTGNAVYDATGEFLLSRTVIFDITELHRLEEQTRHLLLEQTAMLDNDLVGIVKIKNRYILWHNKAMQRMFGYTSAELDGQQVRMVYPTDAAYHQIGQYAYATVRATGIYRGQIEMVRKDGQPIWIDLNGALLSAETDEFIWLLVDITALKQAEEIRFKAVELEAENRQLREASRLKNIFMANMSHELRTPLNAVIGFSDLLKTGVVRPDAPKFGSYISQIGASGRHLLQLIDGVLDFAKVEAGLFEFHPEPVQLAVLVRDVIDMLQGVAQDKRIVIATDIEAAVNDLVIDPLRLRQVLANYLSNALKFTPQAGHVTVRACAEGSDRVRIEVQDTGIGIDAADLPRLFTEFQQVSAGTTKAYPGIGLGLALTRRLVEAQGGTVGVRSTPGAGSVFHVVLPRVPVLPARPLH